MSIETKTATKTRFKQLTESISPKATDNTMYVRVTEKTVGKTMKFQGYEVACPSNETTVHEVKFSTDIEIVGAAAMTITAQEGDKLQLKITDKDNLLGYGAGVVLSHMGRDLPAIMLKDKTIIIESSSALTLNAGFYMQFSYQNNGGSNAKMCFAYKYFS